MPEVVSGRGEGRGEWAYRGACRHSDLDPDSWFPKTPAAPAALKAKAVCKKCPVLERCRDEALAMPDVWGIWGGQDERHRALQRRQAC